VLILAVVASRSRGLALAAVAGIAVLASLAVAAWWNPEVVASAPATGDQTVLAVAPGVGHFAALFALYLPCFLMGSALALHTPSARTGSLLIGAGGLYSVVALFVTALDIHLGFGLLWGGVVIVALEGRGALRRQLSRRDVVWLGERSYSLFLVHFSVFYLVSYLVSLFIPHRTAVYFVITRAAGIPLALLAAMTLFWFVERRFAHGLTTTDRFWPGRADTSSRRISFGTTPA
jgi:peptidoglycan/LPS O-acetylase OafA/YrhL